MQLIIILGLLLWSGSSTYLIQRYLELRFAPANQSEVLGFSMPFNVIDRRP